MFSSENFSEAQLSSHWSDLDVCVVIFFHLKRDNIFSNPLNLGVMLQITISPMSNRTNGLDYLLQTKL